MNVTKEPVSNGAASSFLPPPSRRAGLPALVRVHVQVELRAQVEVEKGVDAEDEEEDRHDDQERILQDRAQFTRPFDPASSLCCALFNAAVALSWMFASPPRGFLCYLNLLQLCNQRATSFYWLVLKHEKRECN